MEQPTTPNQKQPDKLRRPQRQRGHRYAAGIGALFVIFAIIGAITVVLGSIRLTQDLLDNQREKEMFEEIIQPVLMFDPVPFESAATLDNEPLLFYSMWSILSKERALEYPVSENQEMMIPASDLDAAAYNLFGDIVTLEHQSFGDDFNRYLYNEDTKTYHIPPGRELYVYSAKVEEIHKDGEHYHVIAGYVPPADAWSSIFAGGAENEVDKTMIYVMEPVDDDDGWRLLMVVDDPKSPGLEGKQLTEEEQEIPPATAETPPSSAESSSESTEEPAEVLDKSPTILTDSTDDTSDENQDEDSGEQEPSQEEPAEEPVEEPSTEE